MKKIILENANFGLFTDLPPIRENGEEKEDDRSNAMFTELANSLLNEFTPLCKDAFTLEIREFKCGEDEPHSYARIALLDDKGHDAVVGSKKKPVFCLDATQYYTASNRDDPDQNYMGKLVIRVFMYFLKPRKSPSDGEGSHLAENLHHPMAKVLILPRTFWRMCYCAWRRCITTSRLQNTSPNGILTTGMHRRSICLGFRRGHSFFSGTGSYRLPVSFASSPLLHI